MNDERALDYLTNLDPDELVDVLQITTDELLYFFHDRVIKYMEDNEDYVYEDS